MRKLLFFGLLVGISLHAAAYFNWKKQGIALAQEAHVIALKSEDAAHAKCAWERLQKAQKEWEQVQEDIRDAYVLVPDPKFYGTQGTYKKGFENGFQFSEDFKYIVPKPYQNVPTSTGSIWFPSIGGGSCWCYDANGGHGCPCGTLVN